MSGIKKAKGIMQVTINGQPVTQIEGEAGHYTVYLPKMEGSPKMPRKAQKAARVIVKWIDGNNAFEAKRQDFIKRHSKTGQFVFRVA